MRAGMRRLWTRLKQIARFRKPGDGHEPYARVRVPVKKGPPSRSASVALEEPPQ